MSEDSFTTASASTASESVPEMVPAVSQQNEQVQFRTEAGQLLLILPAETDPAAGLGWSDLLQQLQQRLSAGKRFWQSQAPVHLVVANRLLDGRQLGAIAESLATAQLQLKRVHTSRRQTAVAAATAGYSVEQDSPSALNQATVPAALADPLYLQTTVRSGVEVRHSGTVVVVGDLNPGSSVVADGDVVVWGRLRGIAHAGAKGNRQCRIMALQMEPTQLRIADQVARGPETPPTQFQAEVAYVTPGGIQIVQATDFSKN